MFKESIVILFTPVDLLTTLLTGVFGNSSGFFSTSNEPSGNDDSQSSFETTEKKGKWSDEYAFDKCGICM